MNNWFLKFIINKLKKNKVERANVEFEKATSIGFIFDSVEEYQKSSYLLKEIENTSKKISSMVNFLPSKEEKPSFNYFNSKQVSLLGKIKSESLLDFNKEKFDFLFYFGKNKTQLIEYILLKNNAKCRVGYFKEENEYLFDLMFSNVISNKEVINRIKEIKVK